MIENKKDLQEKILATAQAISKQDDLDLEVKDLETDFFSQNQSLFFEKNITIPNSDDKDDLRSISDLAICYNKFHDKDLHFKERFKENFAPEEQSLIDDFEKIRVIYKMQDHYLGLVQNILDKIGRDIQTIFEKGQLRKFHLILLGELFKEEKNLPQDLELTILKIKEDFDLKIINKISQIAKEYNNQKIFLEKIHEFLEFLKNQEDEEKKNQENDKKNDIKKDLPRKNSELPQSKQQKQGGDLKDEEQKCKKKQPEPQNATKNKSLGQDKNQDQKNTQTAASKDREQLLSEKIEFHKKYTIFTSKYDEIILPEKVIDKYELESLRMNLDSKIEKLQKISRKLNIKLKKKLLAKHHISEENSETQGILNRKKLAQIIASSHEKNFFIKKNQHDYQNTVVTILLDNSGSMRGLPITMSAMACEVLAKSLEDFNIKTEILGFTTADWKGGKSRLLWQRSDSPKNPGRINDLRHIVYKSANQNFKKAKANLGLMLKEGILKENIDGEALLWARSRLLQREENRKILMIISDGTPIDDSTNSLNEEEILINHLHHVITKIEKESKIELVGIGIGHDVTEFYKNSITIKNAEDLGDVMISKLLDLI